MRHKFFIAGTDTDAGKTLVATALLTAANRQGLSTAAVKPVAAGCEKTAQGLRNDDALKLQRAMSLELPYDQINPIALEPPIAPHIAAHQVGKTLRASPLAGYCRGVLMKSANLSLVEGAGGWRVPLNAFETLADLAKELDLPVVLVVGMKLGCINHALLTVEAIKQDGLPLAGWVANMLDPNMRCPDENLATLISLIPAPCIGVIPFLTNPSPELAAAELRLDTLFASQS